MYTELEILSHFDTNLSIEEDEYYPAGNENDISYHFWLDLEHGYCETAGSRIHLYADDERWAVVLEKSGYQNRGFRAEIECCYFGNCVDYPVDHYTERSYISNVSRIELISDEEWERITNKEGDDMEKFEIIDPAARYVVIRDVEVPIEQNVSKYRSLGIHSRKEDNPRNLISFEDLVRYYHDVHPSLISATEAEIRQHIPGDIRKIMTIDNFHFSSVYSENHNPAEEELYQLIAKILVTRDPSFWKPALPANNHWSNWKSGNL